MVPYEFLGNAELFGEDEYLDRLRPLAVLVDGRVENHGTVGLAVHDRRTEVRSLGPEAGAAVAQGQSYAAELAVARRAAGTEGELVFEGGRPDDGVQDLSQTHDVAVELLSRHGHAVLPEHVYAPDLHRRDAEAFGGHVHELLDGEVHLRGAEAAHRTREDIVGRRGADVGAHVGHGIGAAALYETPPVHPGRHAGIGPRVAEHIDRGRAEAAVLAEADAVVESVGVALIAFAHGPLALVDDFHRPSDRPRGQGGPGAHDSRRVVLAAEAAAHGRIENLDSGEKTPQGRGDEAPRRKGMLHAPVNLHYSVRARNGHRRFGLHIGMFDELGREALVEDEVAARKGRLRVAPPHLAVVDDIVPFPEAEDGGRGLEGGPRIEEGRQFLGLFFDEGGCREGLRPGLRDDEGDDLPLETYDVLGEDGIVRIDLAVSHLTGHVLGAKDGEDAGSGRGRGDADPQSAGMDEAGIDRHGVSHPGELHIAGVFGATRGLGPGVVAVDGFFGLIHRALLHLSGRSDPAVRNTYFCIYSRFVQCGRPDDSGEHPAAGVPAVIAHRAGEVRMDIRDGFRTGIRACTMDIGSKGGFTGLSIPDIFYQSLP